MTDTPSAPAAAPRRSGELILEVACEQFYRQGVRAVGVDEVVTRAGFTKPSLYRAFGSKEGLIAAYLKVQEQALWRSLDEAAGLCPLDPRAQLRAWLSGVAAAAAEPGARGCALSNAAVEFPEKDHPARTAAEAAKAELRLRLRALAGKAGASDPDQAGDSLLLLVEGALISGQLFGGDGPARALLAAAETLLGGAEPASIEPLPAAAPRKPPRPRAPRQVVDEYQPSLF
jgi:AcrR family transcriptional regulator